jgi:recombination protein RecT
MSEQQLIEYRQQLTQYKDSFAKVLPPHLSIDKLTRMAESAVRLNEKLLSCERGSLMRSIMTGAILGLEIDGVTGQAFLVPFKGKIQLIIGYKGFVTLAANSGYRLEGEIVRATDKFSYENGLSPYLRHSPLSPTATEEQRGQIVAAYAVARHTSSTLSGFRVVTIDQILKIRDSSQGYKYDASSSPWGTNFAEMARKTAIRALADQLPLNVNRAAAFEAKHEKSGKPVFLNSEGIPEVDLT